jgi:hypothetical protein
MAFNDPRNANSLFTRDIFFKDAGNRPIPANKALLARGDGGTYWADCGSTPQVAFNFLRASTIEYAASNASNAIWLEPGTGIEFYSTMIGGQPIVYIAGKGPETLNVLGGGSIDLLSLPDDLVTGRTLTFASAGDVSLTVSAATVTFSATSASTISTLLGVQADTSNLYSTSQSILEQISSLEQETYLFVVSSAISTFYSTLIYTKDLSEDLSTFVHSTFQVVNSTLVITYPNVYIDDLTVNNLHAPIVSTYSSLYWSSGFGVQTQTSNLYLSTIVGDSSPIISFDNANNRLGINLGETPPRTTLDISGIVFANNFVTASDRRLKTDLTPLVPTSIPVGYRFSWLRGGGVDVGCMADEVEKVLPECVTVGADGFQAVDYARLVPYCFTLIQDLRDRLTALESRDHLCKYLHTASTH